MRLVAAVALACALVLVPAAGADSIGYTIVSGTVGDNGWYRSAVQVQINASPPTTCPATASFTWSSSFVDCTWGSQNTPFHLQFNIDSTPPTVTGANVDRGPDRNGWYTHALSVTFTGSDGGSGESRRAPRRRTRDLDGGTGDRAPAVTRQATRAGRGRSPSSTTRPRRP